jgi:hypothetical protein
MILAATDAFAKPRRFYSSSVNRAPTLNTTTRGRSNRNMANAFHSRTGFRLPDSYHAVARTDARESLWAPACRLST